MMKVLVVQPELCTGCRICEIACSFSKTRSFNPAESRIKIVKIEEEGIDFPLTCLHCEDAPCVENCPVGAMWRDGSAVVLDRDLCLGCKVCLMVCPFGAITLKNGKPIKCDLCGGDPFCVKVCPTGAIIFEDETRVRRKKAREYIKKVVEVV